MSTKKPTKKRASKKAQPKSPTKKATSARASNGKAAVAKGRKFEDAVAELYRLLGAEVTQGVMVCQKKVDILATFQIPGSSSVHRVIVECKDEKKAVAQNSRVMEFTGLLSTARKSGEADSAEIITRVPWSEAAKGHGIASGVKVLTYAQKLSQLIDFTGYLNDLIDRFAKADSGRPADPPLAAYYVDLSAERLDNGAVVNIPVLDDYVRQWLALDANRRHLAILGSYGAGKSSFCLKFAHDLALSHISKSHVTRIPILLNLREFTKTLKVEALISSFLDEECGVVNPRFKLFKAMNDAGAFLLIFDGFDEMAIRVDSDTLEANLQEIEKLAASPLSKIILTSRPEYFVSSEEEGTVLNPRLAVIRTRETDYEPIRISPWGEGQVEEFLKKRVPLIKEATEPWTYYKDHINRLPNLNDMSQRPVLLEMIVKTLPDLVMHQSGITLNNLYAFYLSGELKRQKVLKRRALLIKDDARLSTLKSLAIDIFRGDIKTLNYAEALSRVTREIKPPIDEREAYTRDFLSSSFLIRKGNEYHFSHRSILDYLVASELIDDINHNNPQRFGSAPINQLIGTFLVNYKPNVDTLWKWIDDSKSMNIGGIYLGGNAATLLNLLSKSILAGIDLSGTNLTGANLSGADLRETNFAGAVLKHVSLEGAKFFKEDVSQASLSSTIISYIFKTITDYSIEDGLTKIIEELERLHLFGDSAQYSDIHSMSYSIQFLKNELINTLSVQVNDNDEMVTIRKLLSSTFSTDVFVYADEYEHLEKGDD